MVLVEVFCLQTGQYQVTTLHIVVATAEALRIDVDDGQVASVWTARLRSELESDC